MKENRRLLIVFVRNPELGKVKTRLASRIGDAAALEVYLQLMQHTAHSTAGQEAVVEVHYSDEIPSKDIWDGVGRKLQKGKDLGERMYEAFHQGFQEAYQQIVLIGSDIPDLKKQDIQAGFAALEQNDYVIGPAGDGGYYLIGMKSLNSNIFRNKTWSSEKVLQETLEDLKAEKLTLLPERNDLDTYEDLKRFSQFQQYIKDQ